MYTYYTFIVPLGVTMASVSFSSLQYLHFLHLSFLAYPTLNLNRRSTLPPRSLSCDTAFNPLRHVRYITFSTRHANNSRLCRTIARSLFRFLQSPPLNLHFLTSVSVSFTLFLLSYSTSPTSLFFFPNPPPFPPRHHLHTCPVHVPTPPPPPRRTVYTSVPPPLPNIFLPLLHSLT